MRSCGWCGSVREFLDAEVPDVARSLTGFVTGRLNLPVDRGQERPGPPRCAFSGTSWGKPFGPGPARRTGRSCSSTSCRVSGAGAPMPSSSPRVWPLSSSSRARRRRDAPTSTRFAPTLATSRATTPLHAGSPYRRCSSAWARGSCRVRSKACPSSDRRGSRPRFSGSPPLGRGRPACRGVGRGRVRPAAQPDRRGTLDLPPRAAASHPARRQRGCRARGRAAPGRGGRGAPEGRASPGAGHGCARRGQDARGAAVRPLDPLLRRSGQPTGRVPRRPVEFALYLRQRETASG